MSSKSSKAGVEARSSNVSADPVCEFYTDHPFPPPVDNLDRARDMWQDENVHRAEYHLLWANREYRPDLDVLVAGCGTFQAAKYALCHPAARVVGIDVSTTSLKHTETLKQKYDLTNLEMRQVAIEDAGDLDREFDHIVCTGVLHHLGDPDAGLRALRSVLRPDGAMYLMVYAPYGRTGVYMLQEYCRRLGIGTSKQEISELISVLKMMPQNHPLLSSQGGSREFNSEALPDVLLNPRDRSYSVPELFDFLERNEMMLGRWYWQAPYLPQCGAISVTPHASRMAELPETEQYIEMELWRGLMPNHSFVAYRNDGHNDRLKVRFNDERNLRYVPIRLPWTMLVTEGIPPGVVGVLLNQTHLFSDLAVYLNAEQKRMFEAIDGRRNIAEIVDEVGEAWAESFAPVFFEKLYRHDQVVIDASKA